MATRSCHRALIGAAAALAAMALAGPAPATQPDWLAGLHLKTDASRYPLPEAGRPNAGGTLTLVNRLPDPVYAGGCNPVLLERQGADGTWRQGAPLRECFWEGYAVKFPGNADSRLPFDLPAETGTWRLRMDVSIGCLDGKPLSQAACTDAGTILSPAFTVAAEPG